MNVFLLMEFRCIIIGNFVCIKLVNKINEIFDRVLICIKKNLLVFGMIVDVYVLIICVNWNIDKMLFFRNVIDIMRNFNKEV